MHLIGHQVDRVVVQSGDSIAGIAIRKYGQASYTILDLLKLANPDLQDVDRISVGQTVVLPQLSEGFTVVQKESGGFGIFVYSTTGPMRAAGLADALKGRGFHVEVSTAIIGANKTVYRVIIGPLDSEADAITVCKQLQRAVRDDERLARLGRY